MHNYGLARPPITLPTPIKVRCVHTFGLARPRITLLNSQVDQLRLPHPLKVLNGCQPTQRGFPLEVGSQVDEIAEIFFGEALLHNRTGDLESTPRPPGLTFADLPCCRCKLLPLVSCSRDDSTQSIRVFSFAVVALDSYAGHQRRNIHRPLLARPSRVRAVLLRPLRGKRKPLLLQLRW